MRLRRVVAQNFIGAREVDISLNDNPVLLIGADNDGGKSSTAEAITVALTGRFRRVTYKKDLALLISDGGGKTGSALVETDIGTGTFELPSGKQGDTLKYGEAAQEALRYCLDPHAFAQLGQAERRAFLFGLTGAKLDPEEIGRRLVARKIDSVRVEAALAIIRSNKDDLAAAFSAAHKHAADQATQSKGAWRQITGENWGSSKGAAWKAEVPAVDEEAHADATRKLAEAKAQLSVEQQERGRIAQRQKDAKSQEERVRSLQESVNSLPGAEQRLANAEAALEVAKKASAEAAEALNKLTVPSKPAPASARQRAAQAQPTQLLKDARGIIVKVGDIEGLENGIYDESDKWVRTYDAAYPAEQPATAPAAPAAPSPDLTAAVEKSKAATEASTRAVGAVLMARLAVDKIKQDQAVLERLAPTEQTSPQDLEEKDAMLGRIQESIVGLDEEVNERAGQVREAKAARDRTEKAGKAHADVLAWDVCAKALAPDGIVAEIVGEAMAPIQRQLVDAHRLSDWPQVTIGPDMEIEIAGRPYDLWSESGQWRADAQIAVALAAVSKIKLVMLDRIDVLSLPNRGVLVNWIADCIDNGILESVVLLGTLREKPSGLPDGFLSCWLEKGRVA